MATTPLTGSASDPTTSPSASGPTAGDPAAASVIRAAFQAFLDYIAWLRGHVALLTGATFTGAVNGVTPTAPAHLTRKDYVDSATANVPHPLCVGLFGWSSGLVSQVNDGVHVFSSADCVRDMGGTWHLNVPGITVNAIVAVSNSDLGPFFLGFQINPPGGSGHEILVQAYNYNGTLIDCGFVVTIWKL